MMILLALLASSGPAWAGCSNIERTSYIAELMERAPDGTPGVPNYAQSDLSDTGVACGPTAASMMIGYWDASGWTCLMEGTPYAQFGYTPDGLPHVEYVMEQVLPYHPDPWGDFETLGGGTWDALMVLPGLASFVGDHIADGAYFLDETAEAWWGVDRENPTRQHLRDEVAAGRPVWLGIGLADPIAGSDWIWSTGTNEGSIDFHAMPVIGYRDVQRFDSYLGFCSDYFAEDYFFVYARTGWRTGGDSWVKYNWDRIDFADFYVAEVHPSGDPEACLDRRDSDGDGWYDTVAQLGEVAGGDCDDHDPTVYPGAPELCDGVDSDCDGVADDGWPDTDDDGVRDECDANDDDDYLLDIDDPCPLVYGGSADTDGDGDGDACDPCPLDAANDADGDGHCESEDLCPLDPDPDQLDTDADGLGDACEDDDDDDYILDASDNCPTVPNTFQQDRDSDGVGDFCDRCPDVSDPSNADYDDDGAGDACDDDDDDDGVSDDEDNCDLATNPEQRDYDGNGVGLACDEAEFDGVFGARLEALREALTTRQLVDPTLGLSPWSCPDCPKWEVEANEQGRLDAPPFLDALGGASPSLQDVSDFLVDGELHALWVEQRFAEAGLFLESNP